MMCFSDCKARNTAKPRKSLGKKKPLLRTRRRGGRQRIRSGSKAETDGDILLSELLCEETFPHEPCSERTEIPCSPHNLYGWDQESSGCLLGMVLHSDVVSSPFRSSIRPGEDLRFAGQSSPAVCGFPMSLFCMENSIYQEEHLQGRQNFPIHDDQISQDTCKTRSCSRLLDSISSWSFEIDDYINLEENSLQSNSYLCSISGPINQVISTCVRSVSLASQSDPSMDCTSQYLDKVQNGFMSRNETTVELCTNEIEFRESMAVLIDRQCSPHCRPMKTYVDSLKRRHSKEQRRTSLTTWQSLRRRCVQWILQAVRFLQLKIFTAAQAVDYLDRYLSSQALLQEDLHVNEDIPLMSVTCLWIAAKMEHSCAPNISSIQNLSGIAYNVESIINMEVKILRALKWRMLGVTAMDFLANFVAWLPACGFPTHLLKPLQNRTEEIMESVLAEVEFVGYDASVLSISIIHSALEEIVPLQASSLLTSIQRAFPIEMATVKECCKAVGDLVTDPVCVCESPSPDRVVPELIVYKLHPNYF